VPPFRPSYLIHGFPGHPTAPTLTDATIGTYTFTTIAAVVEQARHRRARACAGLVARARRGSCCHGADALAGLADWPVITRGSALWNTATLQHAAMVTASVFFLLAAVFGHGSYTAHHIATGPFC